MAQALDQHNCEDRAGHQFQSLFNEPCPGDGPDGQRMSVNGYRRCPKGSSQHCKQALCRVSDLVEEEISPCRHRKRNNDRCGQGQPGRNVRGMWQQRRADSILDRQAKAILDRDENGQHGQAQPAKPRQQLSTTQGHQKLRQSEDADE